MNRIFIFICLLCLWSAVCGLWSGTFAQSIELSPITIIGTSDAQQDEEGFSCFAPEYLAGQSSSVDIQSRVSGGLLQDVSIRAGIFEDANVSLNGVSLNNPQTGHFNLSLPVVSTDVHNVDLDLNGQAMDFQLVEPRQEGGYLRAAFGNAGYAEDVFSITKKAGLAYHRFSAEGMRTDGLRDDTDGHKTAGSYLFSQKGLEQDVLVYASTLEKHFGENGAYAAPWYMREEEKIKQDFLMASWTKHDELDLTIKPYIHRTQDTFWLDRENSGGYRNDHTTYVAGNAVEILDPETGRFLGLELQRDHLRSTNLGERNRFFYSTEAGLKTQYYDRFSYAGGLKLKYFDAFPFEMLPHAEIGYQLSNFWQANVKAQRLFRQPSYTELYYVSSSNQGNPDLNPQTSDNVELGIDYTADELWFHSDVFYRYQKNTIDWVRNTGDTKFLAINAGDVNVRGLDISAGMKTDMVIFDQINVAYTRLDVNKQKLYDISKYVFDYLRDRVVITLSAEKGKWEYALKPVYEQHLNLGNRFLIDAEVKYKINPDASLFTVVENLLDEDYEEYPYIEGEPFFIKAGLELLF